MNSIDTVSVEEGRIVAITCDDGSRALNMEHWQVADGVYSVDDLINAQESVSE
jgi:hypothetical protein